ncbi:MAG: YkgJ family cysteine cluster protein [Selenomonadaceae bacterium]|nr:YkgJ family cysteine cluster protein [Selenomonadaceae bacterium]
MKFECDCCGACCRNIRLSKFYSAEMDRGDGVCKHLKNNLCEIYSERPIFCNVDAYYEKFLADKMTREEFYGMNYIFCDELKSLT